MTHQAERYTAMIDQIPANSLRVSLDGSLKWVLRCELEQIIDSLDAISRGEVVDGIAADGVGAVLAAGCERKRLNRIPSCGFYIPPENIDPADLVQIVRGKPDTIQQFISCIERHSATVSLSVTQAWWMRRQSSRVSATLLKYGSALNYGHREMTIHSTSRQLLRQCQHDLFTILSEFIDCKLRVPKCQDHILQLAHSKECFAVWHDGVLEVQGAKRMVRETLTSPTVRLPTCETKVIGCHPATDQDFIRGKKDGKLIRIMRECGTSIEMKGVCNDSLIQITVSGPTFGKSWQAAVLVDEELPTVFLSHVPNIWHRRLIGHSGKNIQKIMKRHGVYVKFYGQDEALEEFGGDQDWSCEGGIPHTQLNLVIKTPSKNGAACRASYQDILDECGLVMPKESPQMEITDITSHQFDSDHYVKFSGGKWMADTINPVSKMGRQTRSFSENDALSYQLPEVESANIFALFPSAFINENITDADRSKFQESISIFDSSDEIVTGGAESRECNAGVIGAGKPSILANVDQEDQIEDILRMFELHLSGGKRRYSHFEL